MMHGHEKSRSAIVAVKPTNKAERSAAESVERRAETKGNVDQQRTRRTQRRISVSQMLARIRQHIVAVDTKVGTICGKAARTVRHCGRASLVGALPILPFLRPQWPPSLAPDCQRVAQRRGGVPLGF